MSKLALRTVSAAGLALAAGAPALAQCSMCRTAAAAQAPGAASALNTAIMILLVPAVALFSGIFLLAFRFEAPARTVEPDSDSAAED